MTHHAGGRTRAPLTTGRLALWLLFWFLMACLFLGAVVGTVNGGTAQ